MLRENTIGQPAGASLNWSVVGWLIVLSGGSCVGDMDGRGYCRGQSAAGRLVSRGSAHEVLMAAFAVIVCPNLRETNWPTSLKRAQQ